MNGDLLLWAVLTGINAFAVAVALIEVARNPNDLMPRAVGMLWAIVFFFCFGQLLGAVS